MRTLINQTTGGGLTGVPLDETYAIVEKAAQDYHLWTSDRGNPKDRKSVQDLCHADGTNDIAALTNTVKMLATEIKSLKMESAMRPSIVANVGVYCQICGSPSHFTDGCLVMGQEGDEGSQEDANYVGQNNQGTGFTSRPAPNRWDNPNQNNPNLSYKPQNLSPPSFPYKQQQGNAPYQPRGQYNNQAPPPQNNYQPRNQYNNQPQQQQNQNEGPTSNLESLLTSFLAKQDKWNHDQERGSVEQDRRLQGIKQSIEDITIHNRMVDNQIAQLASSASREHRKLPSKPDPNHRESVNVIALQGGKQLEMLPAQSTRPRAINSAPNPTLPEEETSKEAESQAENYAPTVEPAPYRPPVPFPQRLKATRRDKEFMLFVDKIRTLYITMPFTDAITQIPTYAKFMKEILTGKRNMDETEIVALSEECSAAMHHPMPPKLPDSGSFSISCDIGGITIRRALCDLGASVSIMPYSLYAKLNLGDLCPAYVAIHLADRSCKLMRGILRDVPIKVKNIKKAADFIVLDISEDIYIPIILGRPFLYTAKAVIDMDRGSLAL
ncbi:unnamed protein product [Rhodiola kirilowii]